MNFLRSLLVIGVGVTAVVWSDPPIRALKNAPPRAIDVALQLKQNSFEEIYPNLNALHLRTNNGVEIIALRIDPENFHFDLVKQETRVGETVNGFAQRHDAIVAINGGFFSIGKSGNKHPVGYFSKDNVSHSNAWKKSGGYLVFGDGKISIVPTWGNEVPVGEGVLQSKPTLIEPGGKWAMNTNQGLAKRRTLVCLDKEGGVVIVIIAGNGLSLFEAGWLMRDRNVGGYFGCDSALAMDGGGSTQIWVKDRADLSLSGETAVHNAVIIRPR